MGCDRDKALLRGQLLVVQEQGARWLRVVRTNLLGAAVVAAADFAMAVAAAGKNFIFFIVLSMTRKIKKQLENCPNNVSTIRDGVNLVEWS